MIEAIISVFIASQSPQVCMSTLYGYRADDVYPSSGRVIGRDDHLGQEPTIWHQRHPREVRSVAHRSWRLGTFVVIVNPRNGARVVARITDRGPYPYTTDSGRTIKPGCVDLSYPIGVELGHRGKQRVKVWRVPRGSELELELTEKYGVCPPPNPDGEDWWQRKRAACVDRGRW